MSENKPLDTETTSPPKSGIKVLSFPRRKSRKLPWRMLPEDGLPDKDEGVVLIFYRYSSEDKDEDGAAETEFAFDFATYLPSKDIWISPDNEYIDAEANHIIAWLPITCPEQA